MKIRRALVMAALAGMLLACGVGSEEAAELPHQTLALAPGQTLVLEVNAGHVSIAEAAVEVVEVEGRLAWPGRTDLEFGEGAEGAHISAQLRGARPARGADAPIEIRVRVPAGTPVVARTYDAAVELRDLAGPVEVRSVAGDIRTTNLQNALLQTARGNVHATGGTGRLRVVAESGRVLLEETGGEVAATAIMGKIHYVGPPQAADTVQLETDHGAVEMQLGAGSSLDVRITTTSGVVNCLIPELRKPLGGCQGSLAGGAGRLAVRTVSGPITIRYRP